MNLIRFYLPAEEDQLQRFISKKDIILLSEHLIPLSPALSRDAFILAYLFYERISDRDQNEAMRTRTGVSL